MHTFMRRSLYWVAIAAVYVLPNIGNAAVILEDPGAITVTTETPYIVTVDLASYENVSWSFDFDAKKLDGNGDPLDRVEYGWTDGVTEHVLGFFEGMTGESLDELASTGLILPEEAYIDGVQLFVRVIAIPGGDSDAVKVTDVSLTGDERITTGLVTIQYEVINEDSPSVDFYFTHDTGLEPLTHILHTTAGVEVMVEEGLHSFSGVAIDGYIVDSNNCSGLEIAADDIVSCTITFTKILRDFLLIGPTELETVTSGSVAISGEYREGADILEDISWSVYKGPCDDKGIQIGGSTNGFSDGGVLLEGSFNANLIIDTAGTYCVLVDPVEMSGNQVHDEHTFYVVSEPRYVQTGYVWNDTNMNGVHEDSEPGLRNWTVIARQSGAGVTVTAQTDRKGQFRFSLPSDRFEIVPQLKSGFYRTALYQDLVAIEEDCCRLFVDGSSSSTLCNLLVAAEVSPSQGGGTKVSPSVLPPGRVLGAATTSSLLPVVAYDCDQGPYLTRYLHLGDGVSYKQIKRLQLFLNAVGYVVPISGFYGEDTAAAVRLFQEKHAFEILAPWGLTNGTGYVYKLTRYKINSMVCGVNELPPIVP
jgi:hypothetical protein